VKQDWSVLVGVQPRLAQTRTDLFGDRLRGIGLDDPTIAAQQVDDQPIRDRRRVGETPSLDPSDASLREPAVEFGEQSGLANPRLADNADRTSRAVFDAPKKFVQNGELVVASDEHRLVG